MCITSASATIFHLCMLFDSIHVLTLAVLLLVMLDDINDISFSKRRYFLIVSRMNISVYGIPTRDTHITRDMCTGIHISRGYACHCHSWSGSAIRDHLDHGRSNEPMNPCPEWIHRFIWSTMIRVISDRWSWSGSSQRNAKGKTQKVSKGLSVRKFTPTCKCLWTDAFKLHIYTCTKKVPLLVLVNCTSSCQRRTFLKLFWNHVLL